MEDATPQTILVVDDHDELLFLITEILTMLGNYHVVTAHAGDEGLERLEVYHPACIIIDVRMPGLNGYQLVRAIRGDPQTAEVPLIILSAMAQDHDIFMGLASGVDAYLVKPVKPQVLLATINAVMARAQATRVEDLRRLSDAGGPSAT